MRAVLEYGETHPGLDGVVPPSPNSSSGDIAERENILAANRAFQKDLIVQAAPPAAVDPPAAVGQVSGNETTTSDATTASAASAASSSSSSNRSVVFPADNPAPPTVGGGHPSLDLFLELGDVEFDQAALNWFKMSTAPTEFKLIAGEDGREFFILCPRR